MAGRRHHHANHVDVIVGDPLPPGLASSRSGVPIQGCPAVVARAAVSAGPGREESYERQASRRWRIEWISTSRVASLIR
jgi:hypothetical protein